ncbi:MAG: hypothetical protein KF787_09065 [Phycisphaeraceae bacterium]|nr:hypothetical protein [Phycisphaerae bacterium]MBX3392783.1 hypothetical protein [Phycisphaeraceae bacterium]
MFQPRARTSRRATPAMAALAWALVTPGAPGQTGPDSLTPSEAVESYMSDRGLDEPLSAFLRSRLAESVGDNRRRIADRLGRIYADRLDTAKDPGQRREIEALCRDLLASVPDADAFDLRINLGRATYVTAAEIAEKVQLRLATTQERLEAERILRHVVPTFREVAQSASQRADTLERRAKAVPDDDQIREAVADARRVRSLAHYYAGWSGYYLAALTGDTALAMRAAEDFGVLLGAPSRRPAAVDKAPRSMFRYEHVARAAVGAALSASIRGNDIEAMRWMDALDAADSVPPNVTSHLFATKLTILSAAGRWADADLLVRRRKLDPPAIGGGPLSTREARLLAVLSLEATREGTLPERSTAVVAALATAAVSDLVSAGELGQVADLVARFGTAPLGGDGFAVRYILGIQAYDEARLAHRQAGEDPEIPTSRPDIAGVYRRAAESFDHADRAPDAPSFARERERASLNRGLSLFYAGDLEPASEVFRSLAATAADTARRQDAAWYAIVSLDKAIERHRPSLIPERDRLAMHFVRDYPRSERSVRLLLRRAHSAGIGDEQAAEVLLAVMPDSTVYPLARREAAAILYRLWLASAPSDRQAAGVRFLNVAEECIASLVRQLSDPRRPRDDAATANVSRLVRQVAHAALTMPQPDPLRAAASLDRLDLFAATHGADLRPVEAEILYRRLQIAILTTDRSATTGLMNRLRSLGGVHAKAGERLLYRVLAEAWRADTSDLTAAQELVQSGTTLSDALVADPSSATLGHVVADQTAQAAMTLWMARADRAMLDLVIRLDRRTWDAGHRTAALCRRLAQASESAGDLPTAAACWNHLSAGLEEGTGDWFEARHEAIRLTAIFDRPAAITSMRQLLVLHPDLGVAPWNRKLSSLAQGLGVSPSNGGEGGDSP